MASGQAATDGDRHHGDLVAVPLGHPADVDPREGGGDFPRGAPSNEDAPTAETAATLGSIPPGVVPCLRGGGSNLAGTACRHRIPVRDLGGRRASNSSPTPSPMPMGRIRLALHPARRGGDPVAVDDRAAASLLVQPPPGDAPTPRPVDAPSPCRFVPSPTPLATRVGHALLAPAFSALGPLVVGQNLALAPAPAALRRPVAGTIPPRAAPATAQTLGSASLSHHPQAFDSP